jgi:hypothetical protein
MSARSARTNEAALDRFIEMLSRGATVTDGCRSAGIAKSTAYEYRRRNAQFAERWADALEAGTDHCETRHSRGRGTAGRSPSGTRASRSAPSAGTTRSSSCSCSGHAD